MGKIVFAEILDRKSNIKERVRIDSFPATIGRSYKNTVIIEDRMIDGEHLRLSLDGENGIFVEDLGSVNGTCLAHSQERIRQHEIPEGGEAVFRIGQTILRLRGDDFSVDPAAAMRRTGLGEVGRCLENKLIAFMVFFACFLFNIWMEAQKISKSSIWSTLLIEGIGVLIVLIIWAGFWSFLGRVLVHSFRFLTHLGIVSLALMISVFIEISADYIEFFFTATTCPEIIRTSGQAILLAGLLYAHLSIISEMSLWKRLIPSMLISAGLFGIVLLVGYSRANDFSMELPYSSVIKPIGRSLVRTVTPGEYFGNLNELQSKIDMMAIEKPKR
jgi:hypothetical protein